MTSPSKKEFAVWFENLPGAVSWYGKVKIDAWANGVIQSVTYDKYFSWFIQDRQDWIRADVMRHTGLPVSQFKNTNVYQPIIDFLTKQLADQSVYLGLIKDTPNDNPLVEDLVLTEMARTSQDLNYYKDLQSKISK